MRPLLYILCLFISAICYSQNFPPVISNVNLELSGNNILTISYDLTDVENDPITVSFRAGEKGGLELYYLTANSTGDIGSGITPGTGLQIQWDYSAYASPMREFRLQLVASDNQPVNIQALVDMVDSSRLKNDLGFIEGVRHRTAGALHLQEVKDLLQNHFIDHRLETYLHEFTYNNYLAQNIIGRHIGTQNETSVYILDGHYDSTSNTPGADDNGSAVAGLMEALRVLAPYAFKNSIKFVGFDIEEAGLIGSHEYTQNGILPGEHIVGVVNLEMIGYYSNQPNSQQLPAGFNFLFPSVYNQLQADEFRGNFITNVGIDISVPLMDAFTSSAASFVPDLKIISLEAPSTWQSITPDLGRSDHAPFWLVGIPAIMLTDGSNFRNPNYHSPNDTLETLNFAFMTNVVKAAVATIAELAEIQHATTWWTDTQLLTSSEELEDCYFNVYPNPAHDAVYVNSNNCSAVNISMQLLDITGKMIQQENFMQQFSGSIHRFKVDELNSGIYFLRINTGDKMRVQKIAVF